MYAFYESIDRMDGWIGFKCLDGHFVRKTFIRTLVATSHSLQERFSWYWSIAYQFREKSDFFDTFSVLFVFWRDQIYWRLVVDGIVRFSAFETSQTIGKNKEVGVFGNGAIHGRMERFQRWSSPIGQISNREWFLLILWWNDCWMDG